MNILYLEDRASIFQPLKDKLEGQGHKVFKALQVSDAIGYMREKDMDCLLIDLRVSPIGLKKEEIKKSLSGRISGWIFLQNYAFVEKPELEAMTIIFSEYIYQLEKSVNIEEFPKVKFFSKKESSIEQVYNYVNKINEK